MSDTDLSKGTYRRMYSGFIWARRICSVPVASEAWFWRLHAVADDYGNLPADEIRLTSEVKGYRNVRSSEILHACADLQRAGLIYPYSVGGENFYHIADFEEMQPAISRNGRRYNEYPMHPSGLGTQLALVQNGAERCNTTIQAHQYQEQEQEQEQDHSPLPPKGDGVVAIAPRRERRKASDWRSEAPPGFLAFWSAYPASRRVDPRKCLAVWNDRGNESKADAIVSNVKAWSLSEQWTRENGKFAPQTTTFLNQDRMETAPPPDAAAKVRVAEAKALRTRLIEVARLGGVDDIRAGPMADDAIKRRMFTPEELAGTDEQVLELWKARTGATA